METLEENCDPDIPLSPCSSEQVLYDVIVIGGGLSGCYAASKIATFNQFGVEPPKVLLLEADSRLGGRTNTVPSPSSPDVSVDIGGQWVSNTRQKKVTQLIKELGLQLKRQYDTGLKIYQLEDDVTTYQGNIPRLNPLSLLDFELNVRGPLDAQASSKEYRCFDSHHYKSKPGWTSKMSYMDSKTIASVQHESSYTNTTSRMVDSFVRAVFGVESNQASLLYTLFYVRSAGGIYPLVNIDDGAQNFKIVGGAQQLSELCAKKVRDGVVTNALVTTVREVVDVKQTYQIVVVDPRSTHQATKGSVSEERVYYSKTVILAVPPSAYGKIQFNPPLPFEKQQLAEKLYMASYIKMIIRFKSPFWREAGYSGEIVCSTKSSDFHKYPITMAFDASQDQQEYWALVAFMTGSSGLYWSKQSEGERQDAVLKHLVFLFKGLGEGIKKLIEQPLEILEKDWNTHPFTKGCPVNIYPPGTMSLFPYAAQPVRNIHFAATETALEWHGYMDGAIEAGDRAADEVLEKLYPSYNAKLIHYDRAEKHAWARLIKSKKLLGVLLFAFLAVLFVFL